MLQFIYEDLCWFNNLTIMEKQALIFVILIIFGIIITFKMAFGGKRK